MENAFCKEVQVTIILVLDNGPPSYSFLCVIFKRFIDLIKTATTFFRFCSLTDFAVLNLDFQKTAWKSLAY